MLAYLLKSRRWLAAAILVGWGLLSIISAFQGWPQLFGALGSVALALGFAVFLVDRFRLSERRRLWDSEQQLQIASIWRYLKRLRRDDPKAPKTLDELEAQIEDGFEGLMADKAEEKSLEAYRLEMAFSIVGTLQWGFGALLIELVHGI